MRKLIEIVSIIVILVTNIFPGERNKMLHFEITSEKDTFALKEPIFVTFKVTNSGTAIVFPFEYNSTDVITLNLYNDRGEKIAEADGYSEEERFTGVPSNREKQENLKTTPFKNGETIEWVENILSYFTISSPGTFYLAAVLRFAPQGVLVSSGKIKLCITMVNFKSFDVVFDPLKDFRLGLLEQFEVSGKSRTVYHLKSEFDFQDIASGTFKQELNGMPDLSIADFKDSQGNQELEYWKWLVWLKDNLLSLTYFTMNTPQKKIFTYKIVDNNAEIAGRPIFHQDKSVSVYVLSTKDMKKYDLNVYLFNVEGKFITKTLISSFDFKPHPMYVCVNLNFNKPQLYLAFGKNNNLPIILARIIDNVLTSEELFAEKNLFGSFSKPPQNLCVNLIHVFPDLTRLTQPLTKDEKELMRKYSSRDDSKITPAVIASITVQTEDRQALKLVKIPVSMEPDIEQQVKIIDIDLKNKYFPEREKIIYSDILQAEMSGLHAIFVSSEGIVYYFREGQHIVPVTGISPVFSNNIKLVQGEKLQVYLIYPDGKKGLSQKMLYEPKLPF